MKDAITNGPWVGISLLPDPRFYLKGYIMIGEVRTELMVFVDLDPDELTVSYATTQIEANIMQQINWLNMELF